MNNLTPMAKLFVEFYEKSKQRKNTKGVAVSGLYINNAPTGLGKTYSFAQAVQSPELHTVPKIFIAHQKSVLNEVVKELGEKAVVIQDSNFEIFVSMLFNKETAFGQRYKQDVSDQDGNKKASNFKEDLGVVLGAIKELSGFVIYKDALIIQGCIASCVGAIESIFQTIKTLSYERFQALNEERQSRYIRTFFRSLRFVYMQLKGLINQAIEYDESRQKVSPYNEKQRHYSGRFSKIISGILKSKIFSFAFPAIRWRKNKRLVLLMTTKKALHGFFDGTDRLDLFSSSLHSSLIFVDEVDRQYLEINDFLSSPAIEYQPLQEMVEILTRIRDYNIKESLGVYDDELDEESALVEQHGVRQSIITAVMTEFQKIYLKFHGIMLGLGVDLDLGPRRGLQIVNSKNQQNRIAKSLHLFRSDHLLSDQMVALESKNRGLSIAPWERIRIQESIKSLDLLKAGNALNEPIKYIGLTELQSLNHTLKKSLITGVEAALEAIEVGPSYEHVVGRDIQKLFKNIGFTSSAVVPYTGLAKTLSDLRVNRLDNKVTLYSRGFSYLVISPDVDSIGEHSVRVTGTEYAIGPEGVMVNLCLRNAVVVMSATARIDSHIRNFDFKTIQNYLRFIAEKNTPGVQKSSFYGLTFVKPATAQPIPYLMTAGDVERFMDVVASEKENKELMRGTEVCIDAALNEMELAAQNFETYKVVKALPGSHFGVVSVDVVGGKKETFRRSVMFQAFDVMRKAAQSGGKHLVFLNSIRSTKAYFTKSKSSRVANFLQFAPWNLDGQWDANSLFFYEVTVAERQILISFVDAGAKNTSVFNEQYLAAMKSDLPVVLYTNNSSLSTGVNLQYVDGQGVERDINNIHLLDTEHFFISLNEDEDDDKPPSMRKELGSILYNLNKLKMHNVISHNQFYDFVTSSMGKHHFENINNAYKKTDDWAKVVAALTIQQLGRCERTRTPTPRLNISVSDSVRVALGRYGRLECYRATRKVTLGSAVKLIDWCVERTDMELARSYKLKAEAEFDFSIAETFDQSLIGLQSYIRNPGSKPEIVSEAKRYLSELYRACMTMDFAWEFKLGLKNTGVNLEKGFLGIGNTIHALFFRKPDSDEVWIDGVTGKIFGHRVNENCYLYEPYRYFEIPLRNQIVWNRLIHKYNYKVNGLPRNEVEEQYLIHPLFLQRIFAGRIGEESQKALFYNEGIQISSWSLDSLFEYYDFELSGTDYVVDSKLFSRATQGEVAFNYPVDPESPISGGTITSTKLRIDSLASKVKTMRSVPGGNPLTKLIVVTTLGYETSSGLVGYDLNGETVPLDKADIIILMGCMDLSGSVTSGFIELVRVVKSKLSGGK